MKNRRKIFIEQIKKYEEKKKTMSEYIKEEYIDASGIAVIDVNLDNFEVFNPLSMGKQRTLNKEIIEYIDEKSYPIPVDIPIKINIYGSFEDAVKEEIINKLQEHYDLMLNDKKFDLKINAIRSSVLFIIGVILLIFYLLLANFTVNKLWYEILSIVSTFIIWEAADFFILERNALRISYYEIAQMVICEKTFVENNKKEDK